MADLHSQILENVLLFKRQNFLRHQQQLISGVDLANNTPSSLNLTSFTKTRPLNAPLASQSQQCQYSDRTSITGALDACPKKPRLDQTGASIPSYLPQSRSSTYVNTSPHQGVASQPKDRVQVSIAASTQHHSGSQQLKKNSAGPYEQSASTFGLANLASILYLEKKASPIAKDVMKKYLEESSARSPDDPIDCVIRILHAKVAQKSYGNEKRFFCPPPCVYLRGDGWRHRQDEMERIFMAFSKNKGFSNNNEPYSSVEQKTGVDWPLTDCNLREATKLVSSICIDKAVDTHLIANSHSGESLNDNVDFGAAGGSFSKDGYDRSVASVKQVDQERQMLEFSFGKMYCCAKTLHISDNDKRKYFNLDVDVMHACGHILGTFSSQSIKVISKPSKKKQSMKNTDCKFLCVASGTNVALFNRLRSQTISTRYLHAHHVKQDKRSSSGAEIHASSTEWGSFTIHLLDEETTGFEYEDSDEFVYKDGYIHYGSTVKLVDSLTNLTLPMLIIRKVEKHCALLDSDEPVSQLHKVAFQLRHCIHADRPEYLCLEQDRITVHSTIRNGSGRDEIKEGAAWTIISTDKAEYRFYEATGFPVEPISPVPIVSSLTVAGGCDTIRLDILGRNFTPRLKVWIEDVEAETIYRCDDLISCIIPDISQHDPNFHLNRRRTGARICLVRDDGVIYNTGHTFIYTPETASTLSNGTNGVS